MSEMKKVFEGYGTVTRYWGEAAISHELTPKMSTVKFAPGVEDMPIGARIKITTIYEVVEEAPQ